MTEAHPQFWVLALLTLAALGVAFMSGFLDAASSMTTVVSTGVLKPQQAVVFAAAFNFIALMVWPLGVAATVGRGLVPPGSADHHMVFGALAGAIAWNALCWRRAVPASLSHALVGGLLGVALVGSGGAALRLPGTWLTLLAVLAAPLLALLLGALLMVGVAWLFRRVPPRRADNRFRRLQLASAGLYSLGHAGNDAQKVIGVLWLLAAASGPAGGGGPAALPPAWSVWACYIALALGTLFGGWRIVKTMGQRIIKLRPVDGFCAETGGALTLFIANGLGVPVPTTHTLTGAIVGAGSTRSASAVHWGVAGPIVWAWIFTLPASAVLAALAYALSLRLL